MSDLGHEKATAGVRTAHLMRVASYLDIAMIGMWTENPRAVAMIGMAEASLRGRGPGGWDEELLESLRQLVGEARGYYSGGDFPAAMGRLRVAHDLVDLHIISLAEG